MRRVDKIIGFFYNACLGFLCYSITFYIFIRYNMIEIIKILTTYYELKTFIYLKSQRKPILRYLSIAIYAF